MFRLKIMAEPADLLREPLRTLNQAPNSMCELAKDPWITRPRAFLRRWSLHQLPQLFNVLRASISLVDPRQHPLDCVDRDELAAYQRLARKPGLTGSWQVEGRSHLRRSEALHLDPFSGESWTPAGDLVLLTKTEKSGASATRRTLTFLTGASRCSRGRQFDLAMVLVASN